MNLSSSSNSLQRLIDIMAQLREPDGCEWDRQQTPESLKPYILEECYELLDAIDKGDPQEICDELGDLLLQVVFQARIFEEAGEFDIDRVASGISDKLERRHPHIFATACHEGHQERWEQIKLAERKERGLSNRVADRVPRNLPALKLAVKTAKKIDFPNASGNPDQDIPELLGQLDSAQAKQMAPDTRMRMTGELLFRISQKAAESGIDPEEALRKFTLDAIEEFDNRNELA